MVTFSWPFLSKKSTKGQIWPGSESPGSEKNMAMANYFYNLVNGVALMHPFSHEELNLTFEWKLRWWVSTDSTLDWAFGNCRTGIINLEGMPKSVERVESQGCSEKDNPLRTEWFQDLRILCCCLFMDERKTDKGIKGNIKGYPGRAITDWLEQWKAYCRVQYVISWSVCLFAMLRISKRTSSSV